MSLRVGMLAAGLAAAALAYSPGAAAEPVWPVAGAQDAQATVDTLATVYVDVSCPNPDDDYWGGIGVGIGF